MSKSTKRIKERWTRRKFLTHVGMVGGAAALYETMVAMNMVHIPNQDAPRPQLKPNQGKGQSVLVLGAGIGGLTTAYLLRKANYKVTVLEAFSHAGGRNWSARNGTEIVEESKKHGRTKQVCKMDEGLYVNLGPGRLPYHHRRVLHYCKELGVELQPYIMNTTGNLFQTDKAFDGQPIVYREIQNDTRGYIAELLAKVINKGALDEEISYEDQDKLLSLLTSFGSLQVKENRYGTKKEYIYQGSTRDGCADDPDGNPTPNVFYNCQDPKDLILKSLLDAEFWQDRFYSPMEFEWQATLFQPVGGMDKIVDGLVNGINKLNKKANSSQWLLLNSKVNKVEVQNNGVKVWYTDANGKTQSKTADFCVSNIPCPILKDIDNNFAADFREAVERTTFAPSCKVGWQANERFWEDNENEIYGGISWTDDMIEQIWYPSNDFFTEKGTLTGAYIHGDNATEFGNYSLKKRLDVAKEGGAKMHKEFEDDKIVPTEKGISIAWQHIPHQKGAWASWGNNQHDDRDYCRILLPDRRFYIVGDQASTLPGWQEGAMMSAEHVVELIAELKEAVIPENVTAPNTLRITQGIRASY